MKRSLVGYADLARIRAACRDQSLPDIATLFGWEAADPFILPPLPPPPALPPSPDSNAATPPPPQIPTSSEATPVSFWFSTKFQLRDVKPTSQQLDEQAATFTFAAPQDIPIPHEEICPWPILLPRLRNQLPKHGKRIDWERVVNHTAQCRLLQRLPLARLRRWGGSIHVIQDRSEHLTPFYTDQQLLLKRLRDLIPQHSLRVTTCVDPFDRSVCQSLTDNPARLYLILSDLGCLSSNVHLKNAWAVWGQQVRDAGSVAIALVPCATTRLPANLRAIFGVVSWQRFPNAHVEHQRREVLEKLFCWLAPTLRVEPGLLRAMRLLLTEHDQLPDDPSLEADFWQHHLVQSGHPVAATLNVERIRDHYLPLFEALPASQRQAILNVIQRFRLSLAPEIGFMESSLLTSDSRRLCDSNNDQFHAFLRYLVKHCEGTSDEAVGIREFVWYTRDAIPSAALQDEVTGRLLRELDRRCFPTQRQLVTNFDPGELPRGQQTITLEVLQQGQQLIFQPLGKHSSPPHGASSPLGVLSTTNGYILVTPMRDSKPSWARRWGRDNSRAWAEFTVGGVTQRMRWIPPGRFLMGSPETEAGRDGDEGPQHEVVISNGYWLFDTPCTQELWLAVMGGQNPSHFKDPRRPVEQVSWKDANQFIQKLNEELPDLQLRLPSEAEWEYACRAGSPAARYGELDDIAWYWENSNKESHQVGQRQPNAWGLHDMLGNVWEWCNDGKRTYTKQQVVDPIGPTDRGGSRVIRGGGWSLDARFVRAAYRYAYHPEIRDDNLGFRCLSSGEGPEETGTGSTWSVSEPKAEPAENASRAPQAHLLQFLGKTQVHFPIPQHDQFELASDCARIVFCRQSKPEWAQSMGRDRFGIWAEFHVSKVRQRLRWIPPGKFLMGSPETEQLHLKKETPQHEVVISKGYWLFDTPCTQELWLAVMGGQNPSQFQGPRRPIENVSWEDAIEFIRKLNEQFPDLGFRLPSEAEWEYACRAGNQAARYGELDEVAWHQGNSNSETHVVGQRQRNALGLHDMLGNVWEWCNDGKREYTKQQVVDPVGPTDRGGHRVIRGGGWNSGAQLVRAAYRLAIHPEDRYDYLGFRCLSSGKWPEVAGAGDSDRPLRAEREANEVSAPRDSISEQITELWIR